MRQVLLGIDTGGTYTDAVLIDADRVDAGPEALIAWAKRLTTRGDLALGIGAAVDAVLAEAGVARERVALVSLSTTLATNALVEGRGDRAALVMIGFAPADLARAGLAQAMGSDPVILLPGGHGPMGEEQAALEMAALEAALPLDGIAAVAVCGYFAVRNPAHELAVRARIRAATGLPVTCSFELSDSVGGPRRALTAVLNARLIGLLDRLIRGAQDLLAARGITAPLMVVRGDGALVSADFARDRPIETILSGPAASLVGAAWATGLGDAIVSDIGGTTTDIAVLRAGRPRLDPDGARVGGHRTMVQAVAMATHGLGGDSAVALDDRALVPRVTLGPRRAVPVALLALDHPEAVHAGLDAQARREAPAETDARFLLANPGARASDPAEAQVLATLAGGPVPLGAVLTGRVARGAVGRLAQRGALIEAGPTPSDAAHVLGLQQGWDTGAAAKALSLLARRRGGGGARLAADAPALAKLILDTLVRRSAERVLDSALAEDGFETPEPSRDWLAAAALDGHSGLARPRVTLSVPLIGLGASAPTYYPRVAALLGAQAAIPAHAGVANAIGAVVGRVAITHRATLTMPGEGLFRAHLPDGTRDFTDFDTACAAIRAILAQSARAAAAAAGADEVAVRETTETREAMVEGRRMLVEATLTASATGRARLAEAAPAQPVLPPDFTGR